MIPPAFWQAPIGPKAIALAPVGFLYGLYAGTRMRHGFGARVDVPVVCVGNFTLGGTGKTPVVAAIADILRLQHERAYVLSRGYGGSIEGPHLVDARRDVASAVGDEPLVLAASAPVVIGADRVASADHAKRLGASVLVMDDGMQNPSVVKDLTVAVVDGPAGIGNGLAFPAGPLRAPMMFQWPKVDAVIVIGPGPRGDALAADAERRALPVVRAHLAPDAASRALAGRRVLGFCGIGRPSKFKATLVEIGAEVVRFHGFPDHHAYTHQEALDLARAAAEQDLTLVTTRKDHVRLMADPILAGTLGGAANVVDVRVVFEGDGGARLSRLVAEALQRRRNSM